MLERDLREARKVVQQTENLCLWLSEMKEKTTINNNNNNGYHSDNTESQQKHKTYGFHVEVWNN